MDGNAAPSARTYKSLLGDSLLLWQESPYREFFYPLLRPMVHYVPLREDLSDLLERISWVRANEGAALAMVRASQQFAGQHFSGRGVNAYLLELLRQYARLQRFAPGQQQQGGFRRLAFESQAERNEFLALAGGACPLCCSVSFWLHLYHSKRGRLHLLAPAGAGCCQPSHSPSP